ncbi:MAG: GNAT family N-acetyltransferase [Deltaproteobacteria bacterium]|nr:GNAT family N-acetyltransferase [Deltaproteobacteria bacterium]
MTANSLRWGTAKDIADVLPLLEEYHHQGGLRKHSRERMRQLLEDLFDSQKRGRLLLAVDGQEVVGYALVVRRPSFEYGSEVAVIDEIFVRGKARGRGFGRRMIAFVEEYAASEGLSSITLEVSVQNVAAREFYRSVGFQRVDREIYARTLTGPR